MREGVLDPHAFAQGRPTRCRLLALPQFLQQALVAVDAHAAPLGARRAAVVRGTRRAGRRGEMPPNR